MTATDAGVAARAFELVWNTLVDLLGTAATATLFRRATRSAARRKPELRELQGFDILREGLEYKVVLPASWSNSGEETLRGLAYLVQEELAPLLEELTGPIVTRRLARIPELQQSGIIDEQGDPK